MCKKSRTICVTNRHLVKGDFLQQIEKVLDMQPEALILREKDLSKADYEKLGIGVLRLCRKKKISCYFNSQPELALKHSADGLHLSFKAAQAMGAEERRRFPRLGISVHSEEEARWAETLGAAYIIYGHIFDTDCKKDVPSKGLTALREICRSVSIPVYAIGGIDEVNARLCDEAGAYGVCMMSGFMKA